ncbi:SHOCT domain-containing protein [Hymenobacter cavernae]|uniref:SHOCT domain-containing protein n=1 Tax=Hymenobacter cavernae TaxID=2044852 RepID=A0ABQ1TKD6_9BACT|nr:SHOCT domain-containing protein [Hymenobacter cavernae]GGE96992.1 hypothetical protein GCM10011383_04670 [Hymenobacter cavernae]
MEKDPSPLDTLRQLKEWLDAGTITPAEFDTLKRKLLFNDSQAAPEPSATTSSTIAGPVEEPLLPPVVASPVSASEPPTFTHSTSPVAPPIEPEQPRFSGSGAYPNSAALSPDEPMEEPAPATPPRSPLALILTVVGVLALLGLVLYLAFGGRESERLTSTSRTEADSVAVQPEVGPQAQQIDLPPAAAPETVRVVPAVPPVAAPTVDSAATVTTPAATPAAPTAADEAAARSQVLNALTSYYDDLKEAPFDAAQHFAPAVERFYTLQNTNPAAINDDLAKTHFPEFLEAETQVDPASLQVGPVANDGTRVVTYLEKGKAFRQSRQQHQQTTAQVRVRFDKNYKIVYLRQERLLENTFTD